MKSTGGSAASSVGNIRARFENANNSENAPQKEKQPPSGVGNLKARFEKPEEKAAPKTAVPQKPKGANDTKTALAKPTLATKPPSHTSPRFPKKDTKTTNGPPVKTDTPAVHEKKPIPRDNSARPQLPFKPTDKPVTKDFNDKVGYKENAKDSVITSPKIDIKSLTCRLESQLKIGTKPPDEKVSTNDTKQTQKSSFQKANEEAEKAVPKGKKLLPLPKPACEAEDWNSWVDGELPPPFEDDFPAPPPPIDPNVLGRPLPEKPTEKASPKPLPPIPSGKAPLPPLPTLPSSNKSLVELKFRNKPLPKKFTGTSGEIILLQFQSPTAAPAIAPGRYGEMISRRVEVLGPDYIGMEENFDIDEVYDDIDSPITRPMTVITPMTEEEEEELERAERERGRVGRPPSDTYDETLNPPEFETEDEIYEDV